MFIKHIGIFFIIIVAVFCAAVMADPAMKPFTKHLPVDSVRHEVLFEPPATRVIESGCVALAPGDSAHDHSTKAYEEMLVILQGNGELAFEKQTPLPVAARDVVYIPPQTSHFIRNTGKTPLQYVFIATDTRVKTEK
jgi:oxalate decarboxylase/phosphoglucose isomerase-like protein (cupin superfamily)